MANDHTTATGDLVLGAAEERADFIRAVSVGLKDLETGLEISFDDAAIQLGLNRNVLPSRPNEEEGNLSLMGA